MQADSKELRKIAIIGPECTGKSELAAFLANHFRTSWVPEYARDYIDNLKRPYRKEDLLTIARGQLHLEQTLSLGANGLLICDTNLLVIKIWSEFKFGSCDTEIIQGLENGSYDLHLLTYIDILWQDDPQREHPDKREALFKIYLREIEAMKIPFVEIRGEREERRKKAVEAIDRLLRHE
jgi:NadR type nicotinamide-nucleotide adenylyltransferase